MFFNSVSSCQLVRQLFVSLVTSIVPFAVQAADLLSWRDASSTTELVADLDLWLDAHMTLPRNEASPIIRWIDRHSLASLTGSQSAAFGGIPRGQYDPNSRTIWLARPWNPRDPRDVSILLHELIHHRQAKTSHWYCAGAQELPAYRAQQVWLAELGLELNVNWIAIILESGCTPRDIHPD